MVGAGVTVVLALGCWMVSSVPLPVATDFDSRESATRYLMAVLHAGPLPWLLALPKLALAPYFANGPGSFLFALLPALILLVIHYFWVVNTEVAFEEASIARAEKRAARVRASQQGDWRGNVAITKARAPAFTLGSAGRPELAFLWKNLLATSALFRPRPLLILTAALVGVTSWLSRQPDFAPLSIVLSVVGMRGFPTQHYCRPLL